MKLFAKYTRINLVATLLIFLVSSIAFYLVLRFVVISQVDQDLVIEEKEIMTFIGEHNKLPESISVNDQLINYQSASAAVKRNFRFTSIREAGENKKENFRQLEFSVNAAGQWYKVTVSKSLEEADSLTRSMLLIALTTIVVILLMSFVMNRLVLKRIWKPFYQSLHKASRFKIDSKEHLHLPASNINEFQLMNETIEKVTNRARFDFLSLKTFSENASHEIQTPIAVMRSKLDLLLQDENLTHQQSEYLQAAYRAIQKLSNLNQSILLLAKIENNQFSEQTSIDLQAKLKEKISEFHELWSARELTINAALEKASICINGELLDILLNNLLSNATKHNYDGGIIDLQLRKNSLSVMNTSRAEKLNADTLYQRFSKSSDNNSNGLGLSIIKQICDHSGIKIEYKFENGLHGFEMFF